MLMVSKGRQSGFDEVMRMGLQERQGEGYSLVVDSLPGVVV